MYCTCFNKELKPDGIFCQSYTGICSSVIHLTDLSIVSTGYFNLNGFGANYLSAISCDQDLGESVNKCLTMESKHVNTTGIEQYLGYNAASTL